VAHLEEAKRLTQRAEKSFFARRRIIEQAIAEQEKARRELVEHS
jgi:predicted transcriptional regulator